MTERRDTLTIDMLMSDRVAFARVGGHLDAGTAAQLIGTIQSLIDAGSRDVLLDCADLEFCDSMGLQALVVIGNALPEGGTLTLVRPRPVMRRLVEVTGLGGLLDLTQPTRPT